MSKQVYSYCGSASGEVSIGLCNMRNIREVLEDLSGRVKIFSGKVEEVSK